MPAESGFFFVIATLSASLAGLAGLVLGALARVVVGIAARRYAARTERALTRSVGVVADDLVLAPVVRLRDDYLSARANLGEAARPS